MHLIPRWIWLLLAGGLLLSGCQTAAVGHINLNDLTPLEEHPRDEVLPLRMAVAAVISPQGTAESYAPLLDYISEELGRPVQLVQRRTYGEVNDLLEAGEIDLAFVCTSAYIAGQRDFGLELLAVPVVHQQPVYYSLLIVPAGSTAQSMADLQGAIFAFTDPMSFTGRVYPTHLVSELGGTPESFFSRVFFTYSHDDAIRAVATGIADGAAVDSLAYEFAIIREPELADAVRIIYRSPAFGAPPVVVSPHIRPQLKAELLDLLLTLDDPHVLDAIGITYFTPIEDSAYESVRALTETISLTDLQAAP